jgi:hypothetical protein
MYLAQMELDSMTPSAGRPSCATVEDLSRHFRDDVATHARPLHAA